MGSSSSKNADPIKKLAPPKEGEINVIDKSKLVKLEVRELGIPKPPPIKTGSDLKKEEVE